MVIPAKQQDLLIWKAQNTARNQTSAAVMDSLLEYKNLAEKTGLETFLWGFFIPGGGQFFLHRWKIGLLILLPTLFIHFFAWPLMWKSLAGLHWWKAMTWFVLKLLVEWHVWNTIWAIGAVISARAVREEAAFLLDELLKAQNLAQAVSAKQREGRM